MGSRPPAGAADASASSGGGVGLATAPGSTATDEMTVSAAPDAPPSGVPVRTIATENGTVGISIGQNFYPLGGGDRIQMLALNRATLAVVKSTSYPDGQTGTC